MTVVAAVAVAACGSSDSVPAGFGPTTSRAPVTTNAEGELPPGAGLFVAEELATLEWPTALSTRAGDDALYVTEQLGRVRRLEPTGDGGYALVDDVWLDLTEEMGGPDPGSEAGTHGITFSPDGDTLYLSDTQFFPDDPGPRQFLKRVISFDVSSGDVDLESRTTLIELPKAKSHHNGGDIRFGPDGYLYISIGDGSDAGALDLRETGQDPTDLFGNILRIDPGGTPIEGRPYGVPDDNPFVDGGGAPEVYVYGLRNPYRFSFDRVTGDLWIGDVGELTYEEVNRLEPDDAPGANLGWSDMEGPEPFQDRAEPDDDVLPVFSYTHDGNCAVTGGVRYRGDEVVALQDAYLYSDYCGRELRTLVDNGDGGFVPGESFGVFPKPVISFAEDDDGELLVLTADTVYALRAID